MLFEEEGSSLGGLIRQDLVTGLIGMYVIGGSSLGGLVGDCFLGGDSLVGVVGDSIV